MARPFIPGINTTPAKHSPNKYPTYEEMLEQKILKQQLMYQRFSLTKPPSKPSGYCANVPLPPQAYDTPRSLYMSKYNGESSSSVVYQPRSRLTSTSSQDSDLNSSDNGEESSKKMLSLEYPKAAIPYRYEYLYIGENKTLLPWAFYVNVPWYSYELSTRCMVEYMFERETLATHTLHGKKHLDHDMVEDIVTHVSDRCGIGEEHVVFTIAKICAEYAKLYTVERT